MEIKICGLTNIADAAGALELGADYLGFVLYPASPRAVTQAKLGTIRAHLPDSARLVGVFVNESRARVLSIAQACGLFAVQLHGDEPAREFADMPLPVWRAVRSREGRWRPAPADWPAERYVVDAFQPVRYGGTGQQADWKAAAQLAAERPCMLAGGLTPDNVAEAIRRVQPLGVDVATGLEDAPGRKDWHKMKTFIKEARAADTK